MLCSSSAPVPAPIAAPAAASQPAPPAAVAIFCAAAVTCRLVNRVSQTLPLAVLMKIPVWVLLIAIGSFARLPAASTTDVMATQ